MRRLALVLAAALVLVAPAGASERHPTLAELEGEVMCLVCGTTLDQSDSPFAARVEAYITTWIRHGATKSEIKRRLVAQFGPGILADPPKHGFSLLAWVLPIGGAVLGAAALGGAAWRWSRGRDPGGPAPAAAPAGAALDPELERRLDEELARFEA